jgi:hypothetical protein
MLCIYLAFSAVENLITFAHVSDNGDYNDVIFVTRPNQALFQFQSDLEFLEEEFPEITRNKL